MSTSELRLAMEEFNPGRRTFSVGLESADQLCHCLMMMTGVALSTVLIARNGKIQILSSSADGDIHASLEMEAYAAASWDVEFAIQFDPFVWVNLLAPSILEQRTESLWIYKIGVYSDLFCLVGNDSVPIRLGETKFVEAKNASDMKYISRLASKPVKIRMRSRCLREVISALAPSYDYVGLMMMRDKVIWLNDGGEFAYEAEDGDCIIEGVEKGTYRYLIVKWHGSRVLYLATSFSDEICMSCYLIHRGWEGWIRFSCLLDGVLPFFYLMRGFDNQRHV